MKRQRGRNRRNNNSNNANRSMESNGPDVKVRGTAKQIFDKYETLARDAASSGSRVKAENYRQHAEHYLRIVNAIEAAKPAPKPEPEASAGDDASADAPKNDGEANKNSNEGGDKQRSKRRYPPQVKRNSKSESDETAVEGLETVTPEENKDAPEEVKLSDEDVKPATKSTRRRKAPSREASKDDKATEAAE